jgi:hypothetical protein
LDDVGCEAEAEDEEGGCFDGGFFAFGGGCAEEEEGDDDDDDDDDEAAGTDVVWPELGLDESDLPVGFASLSAESIDSDTSG